MRQFCDIFMKNIALLQAISIVINFMIIAKCSTQVCEASRRFHSHCFFSRDIRRAVFIISANIFGKQPALAGDLCALFIPLIGI